MTSQKKVKFLIGLAILIVVALLVTTIFQLVTIAKTNKELKAQQHQIETLNKELDYYQNKLPSNYEEITQEARL